MKFSIFKTAKAQKGEECTYERYLEAANDEKLLRLCNDIAAEKDADRRGEMKKRLPAITWQAHFPGRRVASEAEPSGLFMLDIDHVDNPGKLYKEKVASQIKHLGIVFVGMTASRHGLRIVAKCLPTLKSIEECQRWLAGNLKVEYDSACKDWARCSFLVHDSYTYFMDAQAIWQTEPEEGTVYNGKGRMEDAGHTPQSLRENGNAQSALRAPQELVPPNLGEQQVESEPKKGVDQREGLFGGPTEYKGVPYETIIREWFYHTGGEPTEGERNTRLYQLALRLRYITDFNEATMMRVIPAYGLPENEVREIVRHSLSSSRGQNFPRDLQETLDLIDRKAKIVGDDDEEIPEISTSTDVMPSLPPVFKQWAEIAPDDFKAAVVLSQLPILGALGSRLRAEYLDGVKHSPSFQVSLEAPQASGKSFLVRLVNYELEKMMACDEVEREKERAWNEKMAQIKLTKTKVTEKQREELGDKPKGIVRYLPATVSVTKLLQRMESARGLHCFAFGEEIDTVRKAYSRQFSNLSEMLRVSFDNGLYGQDYASENSWSGNVALYYNCLFSGTPKAMRRFYPDVEDGLVSRVLFVTLPDQFGKPMPVWGEFEQKQNCAVDLGLEKLNAVTLQGDEVQQEHEMRLGWLNTALSNWIKAQQLEAVQQNDRTRDIFCRRSAVVGFRAGMLAWFLWDEKNTPAIRKNVVNFAVWVANSMLNQHLLRFNVTLSESNTIPWESAFNHLPIEFSRKEAEKVLTSEGCESRVREVLYKWRLKGLINEEKTGKGTKGQKTMMTFIKTGRR
ncbi:MAG: DUF3987 domain-containing protein [Bacteroidales bacterium]|nr:DUF3987 domain-containing protein [Bacteroidales bacterium]